MRSLILILDFLIAIIVLIGLCGTLRLPLLTGILSSLITFSIIIFGYNLLARVYRWGIISRFDIIKMTIDLVINIFSGL